MYNQRYLRWMLYVFITLDLSLALFERPAIEALSIPYWVRKFCHICFYHCLCCICYYFRVMIATKANRIYCFFHFKIVSSIMEEERNESLLKRWSSVKELVYQKRPKLYSASSCCSLYQVILPFYFSLANGVKLNMLVWSLP